MSVVIICNLWSSLPQKVFLSHLKLYPHLIKWAERRRRKAKPQNVLGTSGYIVHTQTESWPEDPILGLASRRLAFALYDTTDENLARHSCCFLRDKIKEKQGSNLLLTLCVALSPTLRLCPQIKISWRQNRDRASLCAILIEIQKYENSKNSKQMPEIELYRNTEQEILETENSWYDF